MIPTNPARWQVCAAVMWVCLILTVGTRRAAMQGPGSDGWQIPGGAATETNPVALESGTLTKGRKLYKAKCQRCHGADGSGRGPDADPDRPPADLTDGRRASRNPDGVMFYKIWNGRAKPKMPAMKSDLGSADVWTIIHFVKTLRK